MIDKGVNINMILTNRQTGYPSVDRPWQKFYKNEEHDMPLPDQSMYSFLRKNNEDNLNGIALNYFGRRISFGSLFLTVDRVASALQSFGIHKGEIVSLCALNTPEFIYLFYALNKIGAVINWIGLTSPEADIREQLVSTECRIVFTVSVAYDLIEKASEKTNVARIFCIPVENSLPWFLRLFAQFKRGKHKNDWNEIIRSHSDTVMHESDGKDLAMITYTGGSTGAPKGVMLSNSALNSYYINFNIANSNGISSYHRGDRYLSGAPLFLAIGASCCCHGPLCHGMELVLAPDPGPDAVSDIIFKQKVNHIITGRLVIERFVENLRRRKTNISYVLSIMYGGEKVSEAWEKSITESLSEYHTVAPVKNGYGMTETSAAILISTGESGELMVPLANVNVKVVDPDDCYRECGYGCEGELCFSSDTLMNGYFGKDKETSEVLFEEKGVKWIKTGDLAEITSDGLIRITGRIKRIYYKLDTNKIQIRVYPMRIEETIMENKDVKKCAVVGVKDDIMAYRSIAYVILEEKTKNIDNIKAQINALCIAKLPDSHIPDKYIFVDEFPYTRAGKVDYRTLEKRAISS